MKHTHLPDDRLVELAMSDCPSGEEQKHLGACAACEQRRVDTVRLLEESFISAREDADAAFTAERLARQQSRILERLALEDRPAKVIAFPAASEPGPIAPRTRPASRWVAAAAVAGLVVGAAAGRLAPETLRALGGGAQVAVSAPPAATQTARSAAATLSDEQLLGEIELAVYRSAGQSLLPLDELTPRAWEVR